MNALWLIPAYLVGFGVAVVLMRYFPIFSSRGPSLSAICADLRVVKWTLEDSTSWVTFRGTPAGRKVGLLLAQQVINSAVRATADTVNPAHSCGRACGVRDVVSLLDSLLPVETNSPAGAPSSNSEGLAPEQDAVDLFAHLAP